MADAQVLFDPDYEVAAICAAGRDVYVRTFVTRVWPPTSPTARDMDSTATGASSESPTLTPDGSQLRCRSGSLLPSGKPLPERETFQHSRTGSLAKP